MQDINELINETDTDNVEIEKLKQIIQTLSKEIPNDSDSEGQYKLFLDKFNKIQTNIEALELLNRRLEDFVPRERTILYQIYDKHQWIDPKQPQKDKWGNYIYDENGNTINWGTMPVTHCQVYAKLSSYGNWNQEYDTEGWQYQNKKCFIQYGYLDVMLSSADIPQHDRGRLYVAKIDEDIYGNNYTELNGYCPCTLTYSINDNSYTKLGFVEMYENFLCLVCNNWDFLQETPMHVSIYFNGTVRYRSYEDYRIKEVQ